MKFFPLVIAGLLVCISAHAAPQTARSVQGTNVDINGVATRVTACSGWTSRSTFANGQLGVGVGVRGQFVEYGNKTFQSASALLVNPPLPLYSGYSEWQRTKESTTQITYWNGTLSVEYRHSGTFGETVSRAAVVVDPNLTHLYSASVQEIYSSSRGGGTSLQFQCVF